MNLKQSSKGLKESSFSSAVLTVFLSPPASIALSTEPFDRAIGASLKQFKDGV